jgi:hypothetical protein
MGGVAAAVPVGGPVGQALLRLALAHHVEKLALQALAVALAQLVVERRVLGKLLHFLQLHRRQAPHPVFQTLFEPLGAALAPLRFAAPQILPRELAVVLGKPLFHVRHLLRRHTVEQRCHALGGDAQALPRMRHERIVTPNEVFTR